VTERATTLSASRTETFRVSTTNDPAVPGDGTTAHLYRGRAQFASRGIVVLPIQGGDYEVSTLFAEYFARQGFSVLRFERRAEWLDAQRPPESLARLVEAFAADVQAGVARWRELAPEVTCMGLFGVSMGAIVGTVVAASVPGFSALVLVMGGGPLAEVLATARDQEIDAFRRALAARLGVAEESLQETFRNVLQDTEPLDFAPRVQVEGARILVISSLLDRVVRYPAQRNLWRALGGPSRMRLPCGHYWAVLFLPLIKRVSRRWFARWLVP
jgi:pimeloyl-ACP methyl ester carboxylesterase